jgi:acyl-CoA thioesterase-1
MDCLKLSALKILLVLPLIFNSKVTIANETLKIMLYGDSLMAGYALNQGEGLKGALQSRFDNSGIEVRLVNASVSGSTSSNGLSRIEWSLGEKPDIFVLCLGANDMLRGVEPKYTQNNLNQIINLAKNSDAIVVLAGMRAPSSMGAKYQQQFDQIFPKLANQHDLIFMPFLMKDVALKKEYLLEDFKHPNTLGVKVIATNLYPFVMQAVNEKIAN